MDDMMKQEIRQDEAMLKDMTEIERAVVRAYVDGMKQGQQIQARKDQEGGAA